jgi:hypothetical protein
MIYGTQSAINIAANRFVAVGNPYPSPVQLSLISKSGVQDLFYVWDPKLNGAYGFGGYQVLENIGGIYQVFPGGGSYGAPNSQVSSLESGQAFIVKGTTGGSLQFSESCKGVGAGTVYPVLGGRPSGTTGASAFIRTNLLSMQSGVASMVDATMVRYANDYLNEIGDEDIYKLSNSGENISINCAGKYLMVENRQQWHESDSILFNLSGLRLQNYQLQISLSNVELQGAVAFLIDRYLSNTTALSSDSTVNINFEVNNQPASYAPNRFKIVFVSAGILPVNFIQLSAQKNATAVNLIWEVASNSMVHHFEVERAVDGRNFSIVGSLTPDALSHQSKYIFSDNSAPAGILFYRIKAFGLTGDVRYSSIVKVSTNKIQSNFLIAPNPVIGGEMHIQLNNQPPGNYLLKITNSMGQLIKQQSIWHWGGSAVQSVNLPENTPLGQYQMEILFMNHSVNHQSFLNFSKK